MSTLSDLAEMIHEDPELVPEIVAVDARLALKMPVAVLQKMLERVNAVSPSKEVIPGTAYARLDAHLGDEHTANVVRLTGTDGVQTLTIAEDAVSVLVAGEVLLPGRRVLSVLRLAPHDTVNLVVVGSAAIIRSGQAQWTIQLPTNPVFDIPADETSKTLVGKQALLRALTIGKRALPSFDARPALHQVLIEHGSVTAADGSRVHRQAVPSMPTDLMFTIPARALDQVIRMLADSDAEQCEVGVYDTGVVLAIDADVLMMQRLAIGFPNVESLLLNPSVTNDATLTIEPKELVQVIKRVRLAADAEYAAIALAIVPGKKVADEVPYTLQVRAKDRLGNASVEKIAVQYAGPSAGQVVTVNHRFVVDLLTSLDTEFVSLRLGADTKTMKRPVFVDDPGTGFTGVLQQMRSDWNA